jgi:hypothetical protein
MSQELENYQGYENVETWALCLHINNNEDLLSEVRELLEHEMVRFQALKNWYDDVCTNFWDENLYQGPAYVHVRMMIREVGTAERINWREAVENIMGE